jgi:regulator of protease activity HflC (stomatin/prohibitin superfamily)
MFVFIVSIVVVIVGIIVVSVAMTFEGEKDQRDGMFGGSVLLFLLGFVLMGISFVSTVDTGSVGVRVIFNDVQHGPVLPQGWHVQPPWVNVVGMNVRTQKFDMTPYALSEEGNQGGGPVRVLSRDAGQLTIDASVNYRLDPTLASKVYETLGPSYAEVVFLPSVRSALRDAAANFIAVNAATTQRQDLAAEFQDLLVERIGHRGIIVERVSVRSIDPSDRLKGAIDEKLATQQEVERAQFRKEQAEKDAEIRRVEAAGIRDAQEIIQVTLSDEYLKWHYQQVLKELVGSPNNTVLVLPKDESVSTLINVSK